MIAGDPRFPKGQLRGSFVTSSSFGRVRVVTVAPCFPELSILALDSQFAFLISGDVATALNRLALRSKLCGQTAVTLAADTSTVLSRNDVLIFAGHLVTSR